MESVLTRQVLKKKLYCKNYWYVKFRNSLSGINFLQGITG